MLSGNTCVKRADEQTDASDTPRLKSDSEETYAMDIDKSAARIDVESDHSMQNVLSKSGYLPQDCIDVMISLGWDRTN